MAARNVLRELFVQLGVKVSPTSKKDIRDYEKAIDKIKEQVEDLATWALKGATALGAMFVAAATGAGVLAVETGQSAERIERQARALQMSRKEYQEILHVFETFGADSGEIADVFAQITEKAVDAAAGQQEAVQAFGYLNIRVDELKHKRPIELFERFADGVANATDKQKGLAAASKLLGEDSAKKLLPVLVQGAGAIRALRIEANELGIVMNDQALATAKEASVQWRNLKNVAMGLRNELGVALAPAVAEVLRGFLAWVKANRQLLSQRIEDGVRTITRALLLLNDAVQLLGGWDAVFVQAATAGGLLLLLANLESVEKVLAAVNLAFGVLRFSAMTAAAAAGVALAPILLGLGALLTAVVLVGLAVDDFLTFWRGGQSVLGDNLDLIESIVPAFGALRELFGALVELGIAVWDNFGKIQDAVLNGLAPAFSALALVLGPLAETLKEIWDGINKIAAAPLEGVTRFVRGLTARTNFEGDASAGRISAGLNDAVGGTLPIAARMAGQSIDSSVRSVTMTNSFTGPSADTVTVALESALRRAQLAVAGGQR